jgi:hypothetical protein
MCLLYSLVVALLQVQRFTYIDKERIDQNLRSNFVRYQMGVASISWERELTLHDLVPARIRGER